MKKRMSTARKAAKKKGPAAVRVDAEGRTHLVVHRGAQGKIRDMALSRPIFNDDWQNEVAIAAAKTVHELLSDGPTAEGVIALGHNAMAATSSIAEGALDLDPQSRPACHAGCSHCCYQAVGVSPPEVFAIYDHLLATRTPQELMSTVERIREADDQTRGMTSAERLSPDLPCPFLVRERCSIYDVRPLACRGANSLDAAACERTLRDASLRAEFLAGKVAVPCFLEPIRAFHAVAAGMQLALHELYQVKVLPLELTAAMRIMVDSPDTVPQQWLAGEDPFEQARGADNTNNPLFRGLGGRRAD